MCHSISSRSRPGVGAAIAVLLAGCDSPGTLDAWPAELVVRSTSTQFGLVGYALNDPPAVQLLDVNGEPVAGARITFAVTGGGGSVGSGVATTGSDGVASVPWTVAAGANEVTVSIPAPFRVPPVRLRATGSSPAYQIGLRYVTPISAGRQAVFDSAAARWERLVYGDVADITVSVPADACFDGQPPFTGTIDDLVIFVVLDSIDGPGAILGGAGPCYIRTAGYFPLIGGMIFDTADVGGLEQSGAFEEIIRHEMGHVLGFGTLLWDADFLNLLVGRGSADPYFVGLKGRAAFDRAGGTAYTGLKIPVENVGGLGTRDSHWRESVLRTELMTGFWNPGVSNPLSVVSVAAVEDAGYRVNYAAADGYALSLAPPAGAPGAVQRIRLEDDVWRLPIHVLDERGQVMAVLRPEAR